LQVYNPRKNKYLSYRREITLQVGLVMAKSGRLELEDNILWTSLDIIGLYSTTVMYWPAKLSNSVKKPKIKAIMPFKVIQVH